MIKSHVSLNGMALRGINVILDEEPDGRVRVRVDLHVPSRDTGEPIRVSTVTHEAAESFASDTETRHAVREIVLTALSHEINEWLSVDGLRADPHRKEPTP